jgi:hypothetical protein
MNGPLTRLFWRLSLGGVTVEDKREMLGSLDAL